MKVISGKCRTWKRCRLTAMHLLLLLCLSDCTLIGQRKVGYSVLLWAVPEKGLLDGDVLCVLVKSNIAHTYVVTAPDKDAQKRMELPFWQLSAPASYKNAQKTAQEIKDNGYQGCYARVKTDGLPVRSEASNTSKRVYRMKEGEVLRVTGETTGDPPMSRGVPLDGKWLAVVTADGSRGWCFSMNLELFSVKRGESI